MTTANGTTTKVFASTPRGTRVALGLGANLGDPEANLAAAVACLARAGLHNLRQAAVYRTHPEACEPGTPDFLNTAVVGWWAGTPLALLRCCQAIETELGRPRRHSQREARVVDLDLLLFGGRRVRHPRLSLPHPRLCVRRFALQPLAELAPDWRIPGTPLTVAAALAALPAPVPGACVQVPAS